MQVEEFLSIAVAVTGALDDLHQKNLIHTDIRPENINWNAGPNELNLSEPVAVGSGTSLFDMTRLPYISPEQTGRMNRIVDYRTDFYSSGVVFYELLTGACPFVAEDPLELIHSHIAKKADPPHKRRAEIPQQVSAIVMRLLEKSAEDRYQSASGLRHDLEKCAEQLKNGTIEEFELGENDFSGMFQIPLKLYGREAEMNMLKSAFEESAHKPQVLLVAGYSGIGKTSLVNAIRHYLEQVEGFIIEGKFDQYQRTIPFTAFTQALEKFVSLIMAESKDSFKFYRQLIQNALEDSGQVMIDIISSLENIIGPQEPAAPLSGEEATFRLQYLFQNLFRAIAQPQRPLVLFIDDLQWSDDTSFNMLNSLVSDESLSNLLIVGAYRDNEVDEHHPLSLLKTEWLKTGISINSIKLENLEKRDVMQLVADTLNNSPGYEELTDLLYSKTMGNPFFFKKLFNSLYEDKHISLNTQNMQWQWDLQAIKSLSISDNVADLIVQKLNALNKDARQILKVAACIGNTLPVKLFSAVCELSEKELAKKLQLPLSMQMINHYEDAYQFEHDRIQQAAYSLCNEGEHKKIHLHIARKMLDSNDGKINNNIAIELASHFNKALDLLEASERNVFLASLNLQAGLLAINNTAYTIALEFLRTGIDCLSDDCWENNYELARELNRELARAYCVTANFDASEKLIRTNIDKVKDAGDKNDLYMILVMQKTLEGKYSEIDQICRDSLALFNIELPEKENYELFKQNEFKKLDKALGDRGRERFLSLEPMQNPEIIATLKMLNAVDYPFYYADLELWVITVLMTCNLSLEYGTSQETPYGISCYGVIVPWFKTIDYADVVDFGYDLPLEMLQIYNNPNQKSRILMNSAWMAFWKKSLAEMHGILTEGCRLCISVGNLEVAGSGMMNDLYQRWCKGDSLNNLLEALPNALRFTKKTKNLMATHGLRALRMILRNSMGMSSGFLDFNDEDMCEEAWTKQCKELTLLTPLCAFYIFKAYTLYVNGHSQDALLAISEAESLNDSVAGIILEPEFNFCQSLVLADMCHDTAGRQNKFWKQMQINQSKMKIWANACPANFKHKYLLISAEMELIKGEFNKAAELYDQSITHAAKNGFAQIEALASERCARLWLKQQRVKIARFYFADAYRLYQHWGDQVKLKQLHSEFPELTKSALVIDDSAKQAKLDINTIIKASQTIAREIVLDKLLNHMMQIVIENAGAQKGFLILEKKDEWVIEAEGNIDTTEVQVRQSVSIDANDAVSAGIIHYVSRTQENVVLDDAANEGDFTQDPNIAQRRSKSVLCVSLINQGRVSGILYLENNLVTGAFTPKRVELLNLISSQIAMALDNALLYANLEQRVVERTKALTESEARLTDLAVSIQLEENRARLLKDVAKSSNEADNIRDALQAAVDCVCHFAQWPLGHVYLPSESDSETLISTTIWHVEDNTHFETFRRVTQEKSFKLGEGLPGRVYASQQPAWIADVTKDNNFPRAKLAEDIGVKGGFAFPVIVDGKVQAVLEFFTQSAQSKGDTKLFEFIAEVGQQLGFVIERRHFQRKLVEARKTADAARERIRAIVDNLVDAVITINTKGDVETFSKPAEQIFGYTADEVIGRNIKLLMPEDFAHEHDGYLVRFQGTGKSKILGKTRDLVGLKKDGSEFPMELAIESLELDSEQIFTGIIRDITERKQIESELIAAKEQAESANKAKSTFLANMSHELRTPLNAIIGFSQLLQRGKSLSDSALKDIQTIHHSGEHLLSLINDVLDIAKVESGKMTLDENDFDSHQLFNGLFEIFTLQMEQKGLQLQFEGISELPQYLKTDERKLKQIILNLLSNAYKFTKQGSIVLRARYEQQQLTVSVEDNGVGILAAELDQVFEAFSQTASGRNLQQGTGLGLPISRQFARLMGGDIIVTSEVDKGSKFQFTIAVTIVDTISTTDAQKAIIGLGIEQTRFRILVVDDNQDNCVVLSRLLTQTGFLVESADNGQQALDMVEQWQPQLIFMDQRMPVMCGNEATRKIKVQHPDIIVIGLSASVSEMDEAMVKSAGSDAFIRKPYKDNQIFEIIQKYLPVVYQYAEDKQPIPLQNMDVKDIALFKEEIQTLDADWQRRLKKKLLQGDSANIAKLINDISPEHQLLSEYLLSQLDVYAYDNIRELLQ